MVETRSDKTFLTSDEKRIFWQWFFEATQFGPTSRRGLKNNIIFLWTGDVKQRAELDFSAEATSRN